MAEKPKNPDPADGDASEETLLPGQMPVADTGPVEAQTTEQQPDPAQAEAAVNPRDLPPPGELEPAADEEEAEDSRRTELTSDWLRRSKE